MPSSCLPQVPRSPDIAQRGGTGIVVGGTGLYIQALLDNLEIPGQFPEVRKSLEADPDTRLLHGRLMDLDPLAGSRMEPDNRRRIIRALEVTLGSGRPFSDFGPGLDTYPSTPFVVVGLGLDRELLSERIRDRFLEQLDAGFLDEVLRLESQGVELSRTAAQALGYRELREHVRGNMTLDDAINRAVVRTRQFAVRQIRWFRRDPRIRFFEHEGDPLDLIDGIDGIDRHWHAG